MKKEPRIGLSLSGGSALGLAHIGVLAYFAEHHIPIHAITGASAGALVATLFAFDVPLGKIEQEASALSWRALSSFSPSKLGMISNASLAQRFETLIGSKDIKDARIPLAITVTDVSTGEPVYLTKGDVGSAICASAAIPGIFNPVTIDNVLYVDGGIAANLPIAPLQNASIDILIGVNVSNGPIHKSTPTHYFDIIMQTFSILMRRANNPAREAFDILIEPDMTPFTTSDFHKADTIIAAGYEAARKAHPLMVSALRARLPWWRRVFAKK